MARTNASGIRVARQRAAGIDQALAAPQRRARQVTNQAVHSTGTEDLKAGRKSSRLAEVNQVAKPARRRWQRPSQLPAIRADSIPGFRTRYTRIDGKTRGDRRNLQARLREGWEFVEPQELPKHSLPTHTLDRYGTVIGNDDMVLMKLHEELVEQRNAEYRGRAQRQTQGVMDTLREMGQQTGMKPKIGVKSRVDIPRRRQVEVRDDDE